MGTMVTEANFIVSAVNTNDYDKYNGKALRTYLHQM